MTLSLVAVSRQRVTKNFRKNSFFETFLKFCTTNKSFINILDSNDKELYKHFTRNYIPNLMHFNIVITFPYELSYIYEVFTFLSTFFCKVFHHIQLFFKNYHIYIFLLSY